MSKDSGNTKLWIGDGLRISEIKTVLGESSGDLGTLCKSSNINIWAKYKPFRYNAWYFANAAAHEAALADANYGLNKLNIASNLAFGVSDATSPLWSSSLYDKPRGLTNNEQFRALDFADMTTSSVKGYSQVVGPPLKIEFPESITQALTAITLKTGSSVSSASDNDVRIPISAALPSSNLSNYNVGVLFKVTNSGGSFFNLLVTDYTVNTLSNSTITTIGFTGINDGQTPLIPMFDDSSSVGRAYEGDQISTRVCLVSGESPSPNAYKVITSGGASLLSLQMTQGMDAQTLVFHEMTNISGMTGEFVIEVTRRVHKDSGGFKCYEVSKIKLKNLNPGPNWGDSQTGISAVNIVAQLNVDNASWVWSNTDQLPTGDSPFYDYQTVTAASTGNGYAQIALAYGDSNVTRDVYSSGSTAMANPYIWVSSNSNLDTFRVKGYAFKPPRDNSSGRVTLTAGYVDA